MTLQGLDELLVNDRPSNPVNARLTRNILRLCEVMKLLVSFVHTCMEKDPLTIS